MWVSEHVKVCLLPKNPLVFLATVACQPMYQYVMSQAHDHDCLEYENMRMASAARTYPYPSHRTP